MLSAPLVVRPPLTEAQAIEALRDFFRDKPFVFFGTGMSCALDARFGMAALRDELLKAVCPDPCFPGQVEQWQLVAENLKSGSDLESALDHVNDSALLKNVTDATGRFLASLDREYSFKIAKREVVWPAARMFKRLVDTLPEGDRILHALTPNYDLLCEYACDSLSILNTAGFCGGVQRHADWGAIDHCLVSGERVCQSRRMRTLFKHRKHIRLHKVHGSLSYFFHDNAVIENNAWMWSPPDFAQRVIITPGLSKYQALQAFRQELLKSADLAIEKANRFLFCGYGFNDGHLEEYIKRKLVAQNCRGLIVTRDSNPRIEALLDAAANLWLVCKEAGASTGTRIFNRQYPGWLHLPAQNIWDIGEFTTHILGA